MNGCRLREGLISVAGKLSLFWETYKSQLGRDMLEIINNHKLEVRGPTSSLRAS